MPAVTATPTMTPPPLEHFLQQAEETEAYLKVAAENGQLRGKEKREMEKKLRRARIASRLLGQLPPKKPADVSDENTDISTEAGSVRTPSLQTQTPCIIFLSMCSELSCHPTVFLENPEHGSRGKGQGPPILDLQGLRRARRGPHDEAPSQRPVSDHPGY